MKTLMVLLAVISLNSCNTLIGVGRDTKQAFLWTKDKIQGNGNQAPEQEYGAPVY